MNKDQVRFVIVDDTLTKLFKIKPFSKWNYDHLLIFEALNT